MSDIERNQHRGDWTLTAADTDGGGVTATKTAEARHTHVLTHFTFSGDAAALITIESPASTILWQRRASAAFSDSAPFPTGIRGALGSALVLKISAATTNSEVSGVGYTRLG